MTPHTDALLAECERLDAAATKGPWDHDDSGKTISTVNGPDCIIAYEVTDEEDINSPENAEFIAHARTALPRLARIVRVLKERFEQAAGNHWSQSGHDPSTDADDWNIGMGRACPTCLKERALAEAEKIAAEGT